MFNRVGVVDGVGGSVWLALTKAKLRARMSIFYQLSKFYVIFINKSFNIS